MELVEAINRLNANVESLIQVLELSYEILLGGLAGLACGLILFYAILKGL